MNPDLRHRLGLALSFFHSPSLTENFVRSLEAENPADSSEIELNYQCVQQERNPRQCFQFQTPSSQERLLYREVVSLGEEAVQQHWNLDHYLAQLRERVVEDSAYQGGISIDERVVLNELADFYARHLTPSPLLSGIYQYLRSEPSWRDRIEDYSSRTSGRIRSEREGCQNPQEWERHDLVVPGFAYAIPIFLVRGATIPWAYYERELKGLFESLKIFLIPVQYNSLLRSSFPSQAAGHDLIFYIGDPRFEESRQILSDCGIRTDDREGEFSGADNHVMVFQNLPEDSNPENPEAEFFQTSFAEIFFHELGHALQARYARSEDLMRLYTQSEDLMIHNGAVSDLIPALEAGHGSYSRTNWLEFFAQSIVEYFQEKLTHRSLTPGTAQAWRSSVFDYFFSRQGIRSQAFRADFGHAVETGRVEFLPSRSLRLSLNSALPIDHHVGFGIGMEYQGHDPRSQLGFRLGLRAAWNSQFRVEAPREIESSRWWDVHAVFGVNYTPIDFLQLQAYLAPGVSFLSSAQFSLGLGVGVELHPLIRTGIPFLEGMFVSVGGPYLWRPFDSRSFSLEAGMGFNVRIP